MSRAEKADDYREKAAELREAAEAPSLSPSKRAELLMIAAQYDELARNSERDPPGPAKLSE
jgi:hypothetical protein